MGKFKRLWLAAASVVASVASVLLLTSSSNQSNEGWKKTEMKIINNKHNTMKVLVINNKQDMKTLRRVCSDLTVDMIQSKSYQQLCEKMIATVSSPEQDGVGLAGPQVGISRRIVAVQRFDKEGHPFEVYPNIRITNAKGKRTAGEEGCLSIPGEKGEVERYNNIDITYTSPATLRDTTENIKEFTAVIFQHECDHLDGILYTDYKKDNIIDGMKIILDIENNGERKITAIPEGVCSREIDIVLEGATIKSVVYTGGCDGNLKGIGSLLKGMKVGDAVSRLEGITCGRKSTSCPDQLAKALRAISK